MSKRGRLSLRLPENVFKSLKSISFLRDVSINEYLSDMIINHLKNLDPKFKKEVEEINAKIRK